MSEKVVVGISDYKIAKEPSIIVTYALGSCVGICLIDKATGIGGMSHIMLPDSGIMEYAQKNDRMKFADTAIVDLVEELQKQGVCRDNLRAKIAGGADMFKFDTESPISTIGKRNIEAVKAVLTKLGIPIDAADVGEDYGRTIYFDLASGKVTVNSIGKDTYDM